MMTSTPKGRLESLMDDFTDVHGTVLLGMHKELQTLKSDVEECVGERIESVLEEINEAGAELKQHLERANAVLDKTIAQGKSNLTSIKALGNKALEDISAERMSGLSELKTLLVELEQSRAEFQASIQPSVTRALEDISAARTSGLTELRALLAEIEKSRAEFQNEASIAEQRVTSIKSELQSKLSAGLSYSSKMNSESQKILKKVRERQELLFKREIELQTRTRQFTAGAALAVLATVIVWIWLALTH